MLKKIKSVILMISISAFSATYLAAAVYDTFRLSSNVSDSFLSEGVVCWSDGDGHIWTGNGQSQPLLIRSTSESLILKAFEEGKALWTEGFSGSQSLYFYNGSGESLISGPGAGKGSVSLDQGFFAWTEVVPGNGYDVFYYDGSGIIQLTSAGGNDSAVFVDNAHVIWSNESSIMLYDGNRTSVLLSLAYPLIYGFDGGKILYSGDGELYLYESGISRRLTVNGEYELSPVLRDGMVAYLLDAGNYYYPPGATRPVPLYELYLYADETTTLVSTTVTQLIEEDALNNGNLVWVENTGDQEGVFLFDRENIFSVHFPVSRTHTVLTDNGRVVWSEYKNLYLGIPGVNAPALKLQYRNGYTDDLSIWIRPHIRLENLGSDPILLEDLTVKYWFTDETFPDGAPPSCEVAVLMDESTWNPAGSYPFCEITGFWTPVNPVTGGQAVYTLGFSAQAGAITPGKAVYTEIGIHASNWGLFDQLNDYSYTGAFTQYSDWDKITVYYKGQLIWGTEPRE